MKRNKSSHKQGVAFFPSLRKMEGNPYWPMLVSEMESFGVKFIRETPDTFTGKWLWANRKVINVLHIHFFQLFYAEKNGRANFLKVCKFAINLVYARLLGFRVVFTLHDIEPTYWLNPKWVDRLGHYFAIKLPERVIVHCETAKLLLESKFHRKKGIYLVNHPHYLNTYKSDVSKDEARQHIGVTNKDQFVFTFFGGIRPNKGVEDLIRAFRKLKHENYQLVIAGAVNKPASYSQYLQALAAGDRRISFHFKLIPDEEIQYFLKSADVVVLPFAKILISGSAILSLSFGRPLITPRMGCLPELLESGAGWLYEPGNVEDLSKKMAEAAITDLTQISENALNAVKLNSPKKFCLQTLKVYFGEVNPNSHY